MKPCAYCGKENEDGAATCAECGTNSFKMTTDAPVAPRGAESAEGQLRLRDILTNPVRLFRTLVVTSTVAYVIWFFQLLLANRLISQGTWDALSWQGFGALLPMPPAFGWLFLVLFAAVAVGLWTFSKSARLVFVALSVFWILTAPLGGVQVQTAFGSFLLLLTNLADGAILVMAYTAPLKERFE